MGKQAPCLPMAYRVLTLCLPPAYPVLLHVRTTVLHSEVYVIHKVEHSWKQIIPPEFFRSFASHGPSFAYPVFPGWVLISSTYTSLSHMYVLNEATAPMAMN